MEQREESRLTLIEIDGRSADGHKMALFSCSCGGRARVALSRVKHGYTRSCGCLIREAKPNLTHGHRYSKTYASWGSAKDRATNPDSKDFHRYGAVGIGFSERWRVFENFLFDMGERPAGTTLDRIDGTKGYEPGNCRWATPTEQARNTKTFVTINTPDGSVMPLVDYARQIGITKGAAHLRLKRGKLEGCTHATKN